jgi:hypothetical protein
MKQRAAERRGVQSIPAEGGTSTPGLSTAESPMRTRADFGAARAPTALTYDYTYIYSDLKRIAVFAGVFFVILVALSFIIK